MDAVSEGSNSHLTHGNCKKLTRGLALFIECSKAGCRDSTCVGFLRTYQNIPGPLKSEEKSANGEAREAEHKIEARAYAPSRSPGLVLRVSPASLSGSAENASPFWEGSVHSLGVSSDASSSGPHLRESLKFSK